MRRKALRRVIDFKDVMLVVLPFCCLAVSIVSRDNPVIDTTTFDTGLSEIGCGNVAPGGADFRAAWF
jgi:hypothetical protein